MRGSVVQQVEIKTRNGPMRLWMRISTAILCLGPATHIFTLVHL